VNYKQLKKQIKRVAEAGKVSETAMNDALGELTLQLYAQTKKVENTFVKEYNQLCSRESDRRKAKRRKHSGCVGGGAIVEAATAGGNVTAQNLVMLARMNSAAMRKLMKKFDKKVIRPMELKKTAKAEVRIGTRGVEERSGRRQRCHNEISFCDGFLFVA
jgi:SPX domain protein involved in polyphosphate accumulation